LSGPTPSSSVVRALSIYLVGSGGPGFKSQRGYFSRMYMGYIIYDFPNVWNLLNLAELILRKWRRTRFPEHAVMLVLLKKSTAKSCRFVWSGCIFCFSWVLYYLNPTKDISAWLEGACLASARNKIPSQNSNKKLSQEACRHMSVQ
jgi:hypothetical protein